MLTIGHGLFGRAEGVLRCLVVERNSICAAQQRGIELVDVRGCVLERAGDVAAQGAIRRGCRRTFAHAPFAALLCTFTVTGHSCAPVLARLPVARVPAAEATVLAQGDAIGVVALALVGLVVAMFALLAREGDSDSNVSAGHGQKPLRSFGQPDPGEEKPRPGARYSQSSVHVLRAELGNCACRYGGRVRPASSNRQRRPPGQGRRPRRRIHARRRLAALGLLLTLAAAIAAAVISGGGDHGHLRASTGGHPATSPTATAAATRTHARRNGYPETSAVRSLIAFGRPIYCAAPHGNEVALTFDDGPGPYTRLVLAKLRKHHVAATFFVVGRNIDLLPGATRQERAIGAVGDHTFTHPLLTGLAPSEAESEITRTQSALESSSGGKVFLFRPPYGGRNATIDDIARAHGLLEIMWTVDSRDSLGANYAQIEHNVIAGMKPGAIILMHENHGQTVRALLAIFAALQSKHLRAVSVPQLLTDDTPSAAQVRSAGGGCGLATGGLSGG